MVPASTPALSCSRKSQSSGSVSATEDIPAAEAGVVPSSEPASTHASHTFMHNPPLSGWWRIRRQKRLTGEQRPCGTDSLTSASYAITRIVRTIWGKIYPTHDTVVH